MDDDNAERYASLCHAHQSGVKFDLETDPAYWPQGCGSGPFELLRAIKHLRVGIDGALVEQGAVASLLMQKGVFTEAEYHAQLVVHREAEVERYEKRLSERLGKAVKLG